VFVIKINGALSTSTYSKVLLINGAQAKNVYWKIEGAVSINNYSTFCGTIICNNGALGALNTGVVLNGRALTTNGALTTTATTTTIISVCTPASIYSFDIENATEAIHIYPNPFITSINILLNRQPNSTYELKIYDVLGAEIINTNIINQLTTLETSELPSGIYFYKVISNNKIIQSGTLVSQK